MNKYILIHRHDYGIDTYLFKTDKDLSLFSDEFNPLSEGREQNVFDLIVKTTELNFEPEKGESIECNLIREEYIYKI